MRLAHPTRNVRAGTLRLRIVVWHLWGVRLLSDVGWSENGQPILPAAGASFSRRIKLEHVIQVAPRPADVAE